MTDTFIDADSSQGADEPDREPRHDGPGRRTGRLSRMLLGKTSTHCAYCGDEVLDEIGYRVAPFQVYCSEEHAVADQENNPL
jgi:hypothetical protein